MRTIIAGCRNISTARGRDLVRRAIRESGWSGEISSILHGGAQGIDTAADMACRGIWPVIPYNADWKAHGRKAGPIRNALMASNADALIAIWDGKSPGTKNMIQTAKAKRLKVFVLMVEGE